ncbi:glycoside hydrolase family 3 N-terminal domain-containing protein [Streptomyces sp. NPDC048664]|uniref:glycoside hydrolase family 3 N-terminal domain-containing protein n=1 Tax=Streptomyces sp. NPDC048664 TaxID=3154505 RepID=UPI003429AF99
MKARARRRRSLRSTTLRTAAPLVTLMLAATACGEGSSHGGGTSRPATTSPSAASSVPSRSGAASSTVPAAASCTDRYFSGMTTAQRVGQLIMGGISAAKPDQAQIRTLRDNHVGSIMLTGRSNAGVTATRKVVDGVQGQADKVGGKRVGMLVSTDQEGGQVQVLNGPGFSAMPNGLTQGGWSTATLQSRAAGWAAQLKAAGLNLNLAPIADVVPASLGTRNRPIGAFSREFGHTPDTVAAHSNAFAAGFRQSGVMTTLKHFPGLGNVIGNTDVTANVVDSVTTANSPDLMPFRSGIQAGSPFVMVSSATYSKIDPKHIAAFSPTVIGQLLRNQLGFKGVVISDDIGQAVALKAFTPAQRAVNFLAAGGNLILTVNPSVVAAMTQAVQAKMKQDPSFAAKVNDSVHRVLDAKRTAGQLMCG